VATLKRKVWIAAAGLWAALVLPNVARAHWLTETYSAPAGYSALWVGLDLSHTTLDQLLASQTTISEVWRWNPPAGPQFVTAPDAPVQTDTRWNVWKRGLPTQSTLFQLTGNAAYLVKNDGASAVTLTFKGRPLRPDYAWSTTGVNLVGFAMGATPTTVANFLSYGAAFATDPVVLAYPGGALSNVAPKNPVAIVTTAENGVRNKAYWVQATNYTNYYGPLAVAIAERTGLNFGRDRVALAVRIKNATAGTKATALTVTLATVASETPAAILAGTAVMGTGTTAGKVASITANLNTALTYATPPTVTLSAPAAGTTATATATLDSTGKIVGFVVTQAGAGYGTTTPTVNVTPTITGAVPLKIRGALDPVTSTYPYSSLTTAAPYTLSLAAGQETEVTVVADRSAMTAAAGSLYASLLRITDSLNYGRIDLGVTAVASDLTGLWTGAVNLDKVDQIVGGAAVPATSPVAVSASLAVPGPDATTWTSRLALGNAAWRGLAYGNGVWAAVSDAGTNRVMTSADGGVTWVARTAAAANEWNAVAYGAGLFVAVADTGTSRVMTSADGVTWVARTAAAANEWNAVAYGTNLWVAVADTGTGNRVMTSPDGLTWTARTSAADVAWSGVTFGNNLWVAVASSGTTATDTGRVMTSSDGLTWTKRTAAAANQWRSVCYGNGLFVAVADSGRGTRVMTSADGAVWTARVSAADHNWTAVTFTGGLFVAVAQSGTGNRVMTSVDGLSWTSRTSALDSAWSAVAAGNRSVVAVSSAGTTNAVMTSNSNADTTIASVQTDAVTAIELGSKVAQFASVPTVVLSGGGGTGATATAVVTNGFLTGIVVGSGGSGYTSAPTVTLSGGGLDTRTTSRAFPLRLILHRAASGTVKLVQQIYLGSDGKTTTVATAEALFPSGLKPTKRLSSGYFPTDFVATGTGAMAPTGTLAFTVPLSYDADRNPFVHRYHPDHDNLDPLFGAKLPAGQESWTVNRAVTLTFAASLPGVTDPAWGVSMLGGTYQEVVTGLRAQPITTSGLFILYRVADSPALLTP
jgi:hypothetical protein